MSQTFTSKRIDLHQLTTELGSPLTAREESGQTVITADVPQGSLDNAVAQHVAPDPEVIAANETTIRSRADQALTSNATFLDIASPTNAQNAAQVKALTRQNSGVIRLILRKFDATD